MNEESFLNISCCTLTGAGELTNLSDLINVHNMYPFVEWGILYSPTASVKGKGRYPTIKKIMQFIYELPPEIKISLHICGKGVNELLGGETTVFDMVDGLAERHGRIQLNFNNERKAINMQAPLNSC